MSHALGLSARNTAFALDPRTTALGCDSRSRDLSLDGRTGPYLPALLTLEDLSGHWLFENGDRIMMEPGDTGAHFGCETRSTSLSLEA